MLGAFQAALLGVRLNDPTQFIMTIRTTADGETFQWPNRAGTRNAVINWGDGSSETSTGNLSAHTYAVAGDYHISVKGTYTAPYFNNGGDKTKLIDIRQWGSVSGMTTWSYAFYGCSNLQATITATDAPTLSGSLEYMFGACTKFNSDIGSWNTGNVTNMAAMFRATAFNQNIGSWNTENVTSMRDMFYVASAFNQNIGSWNTGNVVDMSYMFYGASAFNQNIGSWNTGNVTSMRDMFYVASAFNQNIGSWNTGNVIIMGAMFYGVSVFEQDLTGWCVGNTASLPTNFGGKTGWATKPVWGTCPLYSAEAITHVGSATGTTTATLPTHQTGDLLIGFAFREGDTTNPSVPSGWTAVSNTLDGTLCSATVAYKYAASASETSGTWTNATSLICLVYRNVATSGPLTLSAVSSGTGTTITYPAISTWNSPSLAWTLGLAGHGATDTSIETAPSGMTNRASKEDADCGVAAHDTNGLTGAWSATDVAAGGTSDNWLAVTLRIKAKISKS